jgi:3-oxoacyl-[acyl-carrier protein] reductase
MDLQLAGKKALITGSTSGIGEAIAHSLAREGASVVVHGRSQERAQAVRSAIVSFGGIAEIVLGDLSVADEIVHVAAEACDRFGGIDIVINNSGGTVNSDGATDWLASPVSDWARCFQNNVMAAVHLIHLLAPAMRERGWGRIIQIASVVATSPANSNADYAASKAAMVNLTLSLARSLSRTGVTVNAISPGMIQTPAIDSWLALIGEENGWGDDQEKSVEAALNIYPQLVGRLGQPRDIANMAAYLSSPVADFISGSNVHVDGGVSTSMG